MQSYELGKLVLTTTGEFLGVGLEILSGVKNATSLTRT